MLNTDQEAIERKVEMMNNNPNIFMKTKGCAKKKRKQETHPHRCHSLQSYHQNCTTQATYQIFSYYMVSIVDLLINFGTPRCQCTTVTQHGFAPGGINSSGP